MPTEFKVGLVMRVPPADALNHVTELPVAVAVNSCSGESSHCAWLPPLVGAGGFELMVNVTGVRVALTQVPCEASAKYVTEPTVFKTGFATKVPFVAASYHLIVLTLVAVAVNV